MNLARKLVDKIERAPLAADASGRDAERAKLTRINRYRPAAVTKNMGVETKLHLIMMSNGLIADVVWLKAIGAPDSAPVTIMLDDHGMAASAAYAAERINRGEQLWRSICLSRGVCPA